MDELLDQNVNIDTNEELAFNQEILSEFSKKDDELHAIVASDGKNSHGLFIDMDSLITNTHDNKGSVFAFHDMTKPIAKSLGSKLVKRGSKTLLLGKAKYSSIPFVQDIRTLMAEGIINCTSFGIKYSWENMKEREGSKKHEFDVFKAEMTEWSVLAGWTQANKDARITKYSEQFSSVANMKMSQETIDVLFPNNFLFTSFKNEVESLASTMRAEFKKDIDKLTKDLLSFRESGSDGSNKEDLLESLKEIQDLVKN